MASPDPCTAHTLAFVRAHLPPARARVLEVGAGDGRLAAAIAAVGHRVTAVDADAEAVAAAVARGLDAQQAQWPDFAGGPYDLVLFSRSLHHLHDLDAAVAHAGAVLAPGGRVLVEDFAFADGDAATATWLAGTLRLLVAARAVAPTAGGFAARMLAAADPFAAWQQDHDHVQPLAAMRAALAAHGAIVHEERTGYLFRYVAAAMASTTVVETVRAAEALAIQAGVIRAIGARLVVAPGGQV